MVKNWSCITKTNETIGGFVDQMFDLRHKNKKYYYSYNFEMQIYEKDCGVARKMQISYRFNLFDSKTVQFLQKLVSEVKFFILLEKKRDNFSVHSIDH